VGNDPNESSTGGRKKKPRNRQARTTGTFYTYHPAEAHKKEIRERCHDTSGLLDDIISILARGVVVKLRYRTDFAAFEAQARKGEGNWKEIPTVSTYHAGADVAITALVFFLVELYPQWPDEGSQAYQTDFEW